MYSVQVQHNGEWIELDRYASADAASMHCNYVTIVLKTKCRVVIVEPHPTDPTSWQEVGF